MVNVGGHDLEAVEIFMDTKTYLNLKAAFVYDQGKNIIIWKWIINMVIVVVYISSIQQLADGM